MLQRRKAIFPVCAECRATRVPIVSDDPIRFQVEGRPPQTIPRSENAGALRFLSTIAADEGVIMDHMSRALGGSHEVDRILNTLRHKWGILIHCERHPKVSKPGTYGVFHLDPSVRVWEPDEDGN
jgi:hypothetical protein